MCFSWEGWPENPRDYLADTAVSVIDATFFSETELPGRDMSKVPHPLVTQTLKALEGLDMTGRGPNGQRSINTIYFHSHESHKPAT